MAGAGRGARTFRFLGGLAVVGALFLGYGWWHEQTHASMTFTVSARVARDTTVFVRNVQLTLYDSSGAFLAEARSLDAIGAIYVTRPTEYYCHDVELAASRTGDHAAWNACFQRYSKWMATWGDRVAYARVEIGSCRIERFPVTARRYGDAWWLWWLPLPHVGGTPYGYYSVSIALEPDACPRSAIRS